MRKAVAVSILVALLAGTAVCADLSLPAGTALRMKLETPISTRTSKVGDAFSGRVVDAVIVQGKTVIPVGAAVEGHIVKVTDPRRVKGKPMVDLRPDLLTMPDGTKYTINAVVVETDERLDTSVDEEGRIQGQGMSGSDKKEIAIGAGAGLGVGAIAGGGKGAAVGALVGASVTVAHWLTKRHSFELPAGTEIVLELSRPMEMTGAGK